MRFTVHHAMVFGLAAATIAASDPFEWGSLEDKSVLLHDPGNTLMAYVATSRTQDDPGSGPGAPYVANYQDVDTPETANQYTLVNRFQNKGRNDATQPITKQTLRMS